jgi:hypothetical protein
MTSLGLVSEDVLVPVTMKESMVVQVEQVTALSPMAEPQEMESLGAAASEAETSMVENSQEDISPVLVSKERETNEPNELNVRRSRTSLSPRLKRSTSLGSLRRYREGNRGSPRRRDIGLRLPSFRVLGISSSEPKYLMRNGHAEGQQVRSEVPPQTQRPGLRPWPLSIYHHVSEPHFGLTPLLTPPEDTNSIKWNNALLHASSPNNSQCLQNGRHCTHTTGTTSVSMGGHSLGRSGSLPGQQEQSDRSGNMSDPRSQFADDGGSNQSWLDQAIEETGMYMQIHYHFSSTRD